MPLGFPIMFALASATALSGSSVHWHRIEVTPGFPGWRKLLQRQVDTVGHRDVNSFCVIVRTFTGRGTPASGTATALAYWPQERRIEAIGPTVEAQLTDASIGPGSIDLDHDVIGMKGQTGLSPSSISRAEVARIIERCHHEGTMLTLVRRGAAR